MSVQNRDAQKPATVDPDAQTPAAVDAHPAVKLGRAVARVAAPSLIATALLYYFGRASKSATYSYFGLDPSVTQFTTQDYFSATLRPAYLPLLALLILGVAWFALLVGVSGKSSEAKHPNKLHFLMLAPAAVAMLVGVITTFGLVRLDIADYWKLALLSGGALAMLTILRAGHVEKLRPWSASRSLLMTLLLISLLSVFGAVDLYASHAGVREGERLAANLPYSPAIILYSGERLAISGPGVTILVLDPSSEPYKFSYQGLRLLGKMSDSLYLVPIGWEPGRDRVFVIKDLPGLRWDTIAPR
jgi:hypothetical protein